MARGWESKSVEAQMETSQSNRKEAARKRMPPEVAAALRKKLQLDGTDLILERRLFAGRTLSHLLCESDHKR